MKNGAKCDIENNEGKTPGQVAIDENVRKILGSSDTNETITELEFVPNYLKHPAFNPKIDLEGMIHSENGESQTNLDKNVVNEVLKKATINRGSRPNVVILKIRIANQSDKDFIEIDLEDDQLNFQSLQVHNLFINKVILITVTV